MKRFVITASALSALLLASCSSTTQITSQPKPQIKPDPQYATLVVIRASSFLGGNEIENYVDSTFIGTTHGQSYVIARVNPGAHYIFALAENSAVEKITLDAYKIYYLKQNTRMGTIRANVSLEPLKADAADAMIAQCEYQSCDAKKSRARLLQQRMKDAASLYEKEIRRHPESHTHFMNYKGF